MQRRSPASAASRQAPADSFPEPVEPPRVHKSPLAIPQHADLDRSAISAASGAGSSGAEAQEFTAAESGEIVSTDSGGAAGTIQGAVLACSSAEVKFVAKEWSEACGTAIQSALFSAIAATLELAGIAGMLRLDDLEANPDSWLEQIPERVSQDNLDLSTWPLLPNTKPASRRIVLHWQKFWLLGLARQSPAEILERRLPALLIGWLLPMTKHGIRSVRHVSTVAALAVVEALGSHNAALDKSRAMFTRQLEAVGGRSPQQAEQIEHELSELVELTDGVYAARMELLEAIAPLRKYDFCEPIRLHTLIEMDKLMKQDLALFLEVKWTTRVFLMIQDKSAEVRLKTIAIIQTWYANLSKRPQALQSHLENFATRSLKHLVERVCDVDSRVAVAAIKCLGTMELSASNSRSKKTLLQDEEFASVVNLVIGAHSHEVRSQAALFVNAHVFQDPGICDQAPPARRRKRSSAAPLTDGGEEDSPLADAGSGTGDGDQEPQADKASGQDVVRDLLKSETDLSMLVDYLENYIGEHLRLTERVVNAFWGKAQCLTHWRTMTNMCMVGEHGQNVGVAPITSKQRLIVLYIMEAAVRRADEDWRREMVTGVKTTSVTLNDACSQIIPELPRLFEVCRPEEEHVLLLSHLAKILIEYASDKTDDQSLVSTMNVPLMIQELRNTILQETQVDAVMNCTDIFLLLSGTFNEVQSNFLELSNSLNVSCIELVESFMNKVGRADDLKMTLGKFVIIANRAFDMTYGKTQLLFNFLELLGRRAEWMQGADSWDLELPNGVPDVELAAQLMEAAVISLTWYVRLVALTSSGTDEDPRIIEMLSSADNVNEIRSCVPKAAAALRNTLAALLKNSCEHSGLRFIAFSCFFTFCQTAYGISESVNLEDESCDLQHGDTRAKVVLKQEHVKALSGYLESLLQDCCTSEGESLLPFDADGQRVKACGVQPAPSKGALTSPRFLQHCWMEALRNAQGQEANGNLQSLSERVGVSSPEERQLCSVLACLMIAQSEVEDIRDGALGHILLMQCERHRPKALRDVALSFKKLLKDRGRATNEHALHYFHMQRSAIFRAFVQTGTDMAMSLSMEFVKHWGLLGRGPPGMEGPAFQVLWDSVDTCITADRSMMPLLSAFGHWLRSEEFIVESKRLELIERIRLKCTDVGLDHNKEDHIIGFLQRMQLKVSATTVQARMSPTASSGTAPAPAATSSMPPSIGSHKATPPAPASDAATEECHPRTPPSQVELSSSRKRAAPAEASMPSPILSSFAESIMNSARRMHATPENPAAASAALISPVAPRSPVPQTSPSQGRLSSRRKLEPRSGEGSTATNISVATPAAAASATSAPIPQQAVEASHSEMTRSPGSHGSKRKRDASLDASTPGALVPESGETRRAPTPLAPPVAEEALNSPTPRSLGRLGIRRNQRTPLDTSTRTATTPITTASQAGGRSPRSQTPDHSRPIDVSLLPSTPMTQSAAQSSHPTLQRRLTSKQTPEQAATPTPPTVISRVASASSASQASVSERRPSSKRKPNSPTDEM